MNAALLLPAIVALPFATALGVIASRRHPALRDGITILGGILTLGLAATLAAEVPRDLSARVVLAEPIPGIPLALALESLGLLFTLVAGFLWPVTSLYAMGYMTAHKERHQTRFYAAFAVSIGATLGIALAANMLTLFLFYELLTLATYPLVTHAGDRRARRAGRVYLGLLMGTSIVLMLPAMVWTWQLTGTLAFTGGGVLAGRASDGMLSVLLLLYVLGTGKAALMPFHRWLPRAMVAPTPVSALLHAVAVVKAGVFTILKVAVYLFGIDLVGELAASHWLSLLAAATVLLASLIAMAQDNIKARLAYSTVSQLGAIVLGAMLGVASGVIGSSMHIAMHAFAKITLFFCAGAILVAAHKTRVSELDGLGRRMPWTFGAFLIGALSIVGLPPFGGVWSKWMLVQGGVDAGLWWATAVLLVSALLNMVYLASIPLRAFFSAPVPQDAHIGEAPAACLVPILITAAGCVLLFLFPEPLYRLALEILHRFPD